MTDIELEAKSDRELLILTVQTVNTLTDEFKSMNGTLRGVVEEQTGMKVLCNERHPKYAMVKPAGIGAGITALLVGIVELVKMLVGK